MCQHDHFKKNAKNSKKTSKKGVLVVAKNEGRAGRDTGKGTIFRVEKPVAFSSIS